MDIEKTGDLYSHFAALGTLIGRQMEFFLCNIALVISIEEAHVTHVSNEGTPRAHVTHLKRKISSKECGCM